MEKKRHSEQPVLCMYDSVDFILSRCGKGFIHTHTHTCTHTHVHTETQAQTHKSTYCTHKHTHALTQTHTQINRHLVWTARDGGVIYKNYTFKCCFIC